MPLCSLLAVGPPLLTLVNFEVENLAYMLVCMQWTVSGTAGATAIAFWERAPGDGTVHPRVRTRVHVICVCARRESAPRGMLSLSCVKELPSWGESLD